MSESGLTVDGTGMLYIDCDIHGVSDSWLQVEGEYFCNKCWRDFFSKNLPKVRRLLKE